MTTDEQAPVSVEPKAAPVGVSERALLVVPGILLLMGVMWTGTAYSPSPLLAVALATALITIAALRPARTLNLAPAWAPLLLGAILALAVLSLIWLLPHLHGKRALIPAAVALLGLLGLTRRFRPTDALRAGLTGVGVFTAVYGPMASAPGFPDVAWAVDGGRKAAWLGLVVWLSFLFCGPRSTGREWSWRLRLGVLLVAGVAVRGLAVLGSPDPVVDVFIWGRDAPRVLLQGQNPYAVTYENPNTTERARKLGLGRRGGHKQGYYPPWTTLTGVVPTLLRVDVRMLNALADGVAALLLFLVGSQGRRPDIGVLCAGIYLCTPRTGRHVEMGYMEPQLAALLGAFACLADRRQTLAGAMLGLALAAKQSTVLVAVPAARYLRQHPRAFLAASAVAMAVVLPFLLWGPAEFMDTVFGRQLATVRPDSLSVFSLLVSLGLSVPGWALWAVRLPIIAAITARAPSDNGRGLGLWFAAVSLVFLLFNNIAHANHYYAAVYLLLLGIAGDCARRGPDCTRRARRREDTVPLLSALARVKKIRYFLDALPKDARILEVGCGDGWVGRYLRENGWEHHCGLDISPPADIVGDIRQWRSLGLQPASYDAIVAFEVVEHVHCFQEFHDLLAPGGVLLLTSPLPHRDWLCKILEALGLTQRRTSPHDHLIDFHSIPLFEPLEIRIVGPTAQWGKFRKAQAPRD